MTFKKDDTTPINVKGMKYFEIESISVNEWNPLPDGKGTPEQVHMMLEVEGFDYPMVIRFKSARPIDELIMSLITHRNNVWSK